MKLHCLWLEVDGWREANTTCPHTWREGLEFQGTPQSTGLCQQEFSSEQRFIWESGCQHSFPDLPAPSNNIDPTFLPAASRAGQPRLTSVGTVQGTGHMNSAILRWPTLAPLFQAMNRAVWKKITHKVKAAKFVSL